MRRGRNDGSGRASGRPEEADGDPGGFARGSRRSSVRSRSAPATRPWRVASGRSATCRSSRARRPRATRSGSRSTTTPGLRLDERRRLLRGPPELRRRAGLHLRRGRQPRRHDRHRYRPELRHGAVRPRPRRQPAAEPQALRRRHERPDPAPRTRAAHPAAPEVFSQVPDLDAGLAGDWMKSMWNDLVFDKAGNLYVPDDKPRIWRVAPDGTASIWFTDPRLTGFFGFAGGPLGGRIDPTGRGCTSRSPCRPSSRSTSIDLSRSGWSTIRRLRTSSSSTGSRSTRPRAAPPQATGLAFAKSGQPVRQPDRPEPDRRPRPGRRRDRPDLQTRCSTRRGASPSSASRCSSRTATSSRPTTPTPGRSSRSTSARRACPLNRPKT